MQLNRAAARTNLALLAALQPQDLRSHEPVDARAVFERVDVDGLLRILPDTGRVTSLASIFIHESVPDDELIGLFGFRAGRALEATAFYATPLNA